MKILTLDIGGTAIKSAIIDENDQVTDIRTTPSKTVDPAHLIQQAVQISKEYGEFDVMSLSMTGQINDKTGHVLFQYNKDTDEDLEYPAAEELQKKVNCPVFLLNDSNAAALGEAYFGAGREYRDFLCLTYGTGVGGGIIMDKKLLSGTRGIAGEVGHMVIHAGAEGPVCGCGHTGCYEKYAATTALVRMAREIHPELENARQLFALAETEPALVEVITKWIGEIVEGLCTLTYIFNPECIILGGGVMEREDVLQEVREQFAKRVIPTFANVDILPAQLGNKAGMFGAAVNARQHLGIM